MNTITFDNYYLNYNKVEGMITLVNDGRNAAGNFIYTINADGSIGVPSVPDQQTSPESNYVNRSTRLTTMTFSLTGTSEWVRGEETALTNDDVYLIKSYSKGTTLAGLSYETQTVEPLRLEVGFPYYTSGILRLRLANTFRQINYGYVRNQRDDLASVAIGDETMFIHLDRNPMMIVNIK